MKRTHSLSSCPTGQETVAGGVYLIFQLLLLPGILSFCNAKLTAPLSDAELNFVFYLINFLAAILHSARRTHDVIIAVALVEFGALNGRLVFMAVIYDA